MTYLGCARRALPREEEGSGGSECQRYRLPISDVPRDGSVSSSALPRLAAPSMALLNICTGRRGGQLSVATRETLDQLPRLSNSSRASPHQKFLVGSGGSRFYYFRDI